MIFFGGEGDSFPLSLLVWQQISYKSLYNGGSVKFDTLFLDLWLCFYRFNGCFYFDVFWSHFYIEFPPFRKIYR